MLVMLKQFDFKNNYIICFLFILILFCSLLVLVLSKKKGSYIVLIFKVCYLVENVKGNLILVFLEINLFLLGYFINILQCE